jgi:hypothetical protein
VALLGAIRPWYCSPRTGALSDGISSDGTVKLAASKLARSRVARVNGRDDDDGSRPDLRWLSLPRGDHQLRGMAVFSVPVEPALVEAMLAARGISVTHETIRQWGLKFGREFARRPPNACSASPSRSRGAPLVCLSLTS